MKTKIFRKHNWMAPVAPLLAMTAALLFIALPAAAQDFDLTMCDGQRFMLTCPAEGADGLGPITYEWYYVIDPALYPDFAALYPDGLLPIDDLFQIDTNSATLTIPEGYVGEGTYTAVCVVANSACTLSSNSYTLKVLPRPATPSLYMSPWTIDKCQGTGDFVLWATSPQPGATYVWSGVGTLSGTASGTGNTSYTISTATVGKTRMSLSAEVRMENGLTCRSETHDTTFTVYPWPTIDVQPTASSSVCVGGTVTLSVTASNTTGWYDWQKNGISVVNTSGSDRYGGSGGRTANYTTGPLTENATYTVVVRNGAWDCSATSNEALVAVFTYPSIKAHSAATTVCSGSVAQLSVTASSATAYQWKKNGVDVTDGSGGNTANYTTAPLTENATYTVVVMNGTSACSATSSDILVTVNTVPVITRSGGEASQTVKQDSAITTIVYSAPNSNFTLSGSLPAGVDGIASSNSYTISGTPTAPGPGTYNYTVTATSPGGCTATSSGSITVKL